MSTVTETRDGLRITLAPPTTVAVSAQPEHRWGRHQFPKLSWMPTPAGRVLLLTYNVSADDDLAYGTPGPAYTSADLGETWQPFAPAAAPGSPLAPQAMLAVSHSPLSAISDGSYLCTPFPQGRRPDELPADTLVNPVSSFHSYATRYLYDTAPMPQVVRDYLGELTAARFDPATEQWVATTVRWPNDRMLLRTHANESFVRTSFEQPLVEHNGELFVADYKSFYFHDDGSPPRTMESLCMVSRDGGRSFERRAIMASDDTGEDIFGEGTMCVTRDGRLLAVLRRADHAQKSMVITSSDDAGHTWTPHRAMPELGDFGVLPVLQPLASGPLLLTYGRPGVWLSLSADGTGERWSKPVPILAGSHDATQAHSCGYTAMQPLDANTALLAYSDFQCQGDGRRAIRVRRVTVTSA